MSLETSQFSVKPNIVRCLCPRFAPVFWALTWVQKAPMSTRGQPESTLPRLQSHLQICHPERSAVKRSVAARSRRPPTQPESPDAAAGAPLKPGFGLSWTCPTARCPRFAPVFRALTWVRKAPMSTRGQPESTPPRLQSHLQIRHPERSAVKRR